MTSAASKYRLRIEPIEVRGTGRTHSQMLRAPKNSLYITPNRDYCWSLAEKIGRADLQIVGLIDQFDFMGLMAHVEVDHALEIIDEDLQMMMEMHNNCVMRRMAA